MRDMAATLFNLWNPYRADDGTLSFEVTQADTFRIHQGTRAFLDSALHQLEVLPTSSYDWEILPARCLYYSSYPDDDGWRDRWARTWRIRVRFQVPLPPRINRLRRVPFSLCASDDSWDVDLDDQESYLHAGLVLADFTRPPAEVRGHARALLEAAAGKAQRLEPAVRELQGSTQLQLAVTGITLPADVGVLDALVAELRASGGEVSWNVP
jgi:hypothetical protein